ncbi:hypothetical protein CCH79_00020871 [Gambusia affinis]|uniref:G-protein coupled receptors family 1 profile domain-containing protein n=1 Tax=Gambusia affinis TaxID=33528 RepID=A0A315W2L5_GAMAF|nr:hypothetical protein CCH79_00020871 [Gambusia affinis]
MTPKASHIISITTWVVLLTMTAPYCILMLINKHHDEHRIISRRVHQVHLASSNSKKLVRSRRNMLVLEFRAQLNLNQIFCMKQKRNTSSVEASDSEDQLNTCVEENMLPASPMELSTALYQ